MVDKYIGVRITNHLYWKIKEKLLKNRISMSDAIINGISQYLDINYIHKDK
ncbi:hypothetical protein ES708_31676 [subsurface metagenome]